jgi:alpha-beta hydrolase superfamily lysophospholipase
MVARVGGSASLFGHSSGAILAIEATLRGLAVDALAAYEPPYIVHDAQSRRAASGAPRPSHLTRLC